MWIQECGEVEGGYCLCWFTGFWMQEQRLFIMVLMTAQYNQYNFYNFAEHSWHALIGTNETNMIMSFPRVAGKYLINSFRKKQLANKTKPTLLTVPVCTKPISVIVPKPCSTSGNASPKIISRSTQVQPFMWTIPCIYKLTIQMTLTVRYLVVLKWL